MIIKALIITAVTSALATMASGKEFPNSTYTYAHFCSEKDSDFKEFRYKQNIPICRRNVSSEEKTRIYNLYEISAANRKSYTIDHLIPLSLGGSNDIKNLWPQPRSQSSAPIETKVYYRVKSGEINIQEAINVILEEKYPK